MILIGLLDEAALKKQIKTKEYAKAYCIYGSENYLKQRYVNLMAEGIVPKGGEFFNLHRFEGKETDVDEIAQAAEALPVCSEKTCVIVRDWNAETAGAAQSKKLKEFLSDLPESCVVIFWMDTLEVLPKKSSKWKTFITQFGKSGEVLELERRTDTALIKLVCDGAAKRGCVLGKPAANYFLSIVGTDLQTVYQELDKLCFYVKSGEITRQAIDAVAVKDINANVFELARALLRREHERAYHILDELFAQKEEPVSILYALSSAYIDMYRVKIASVSGDGNSRLTAAFSYRGKEFRLKNAARDGARLSVEQLRKSLDILFKADTMLKSTATDKRFVLEEALVKLVAAGR